MCRKTNLLTKYNLGGIEALTFDYEKLDFLFNLIEKTNLSVSKKLITKFKSIEAVIKARDLDLIKYGLSETQIIFLKFIGDLNKELFKEHFQHEKISISSKHNLLDYIRNALTPYLKNEIGFEPREHFYLLHLDSANNLINDKDLKSGILFSGTIDRSAVYPREVAENIQNYNNKVEALSDFKGIFKECSKYRAKSIIIAHNHPSGNYKPSRSDIELTQSLKVSLGMFDIRVLDHIIVTSSNYYSFLEEGLLE